MPKTLSLVCYRYSAAQILAEILNDDLDSSDFVANNINQVTTGDHDINTCSDDESDHSSTTQDYERPNDRSNVMSDDHNDREQNADIRVFPNVQFYTKCAVLHLKCAFLMTNLYS